MTCCGGGGSHRGTTIDGNQPYRADANRETRRWRRSRSVSPSAGSESSSSSSQSSGAQYTTPGRIKSVSFGAPTSTSAGRCTSNIRRRSTGSSSSDSDSSNNNNNRNLGECNGRTNCRRDRMCGTGGVGSCPKPRRPLRPLTLVPPPSQPSVPRKMRCVQDSSAVRPFQHNEQTIQQLQNIGFTGSLCAGDPLPGPCTDNNCSGDVSAQETAQPGSSQQVRLYQPCTGTVATVDIGTGLVAYGQPNLSCAKKKRNVVYVRKYKKKDPCEPEKAWCQKRRCPPITHPSVCMTFPPPRGDCYPAEPKPTQMLYHTFFDSFSVGTSKRSDWSWFMYGNPRNPTYIADDTHVDTSGHGLTLNSMPYTKTYPQNTNGPDVNGFLDHYKAVMTHNSDYCVPKRGEIYAETHMAAEVNQQAMTMQNINGKDYTEYMYNPPTDPRPAYSTFSLFDPDNQFAIHHIWTNGTLYGGIERFPYSSGSQGGSSSTVGGTQNPEIYMGLYPLTRRNPDNPSGNYFTVGLALDRRYGARWYLNGSKVLELPVLTSPAERVNLLSNYGGQYEDVRPLIKRVRVMVGHWSYLDGLNTHTGAAINQVQRKNGDPNPETPPALVNLRNPDGVTNISYSNSSYVDVLSQTSYSPRPVNYVEGSVGSSPITVPPTSRIWGQGAKMNMKYLMIQNRC